MSSDPPSQQRPTSGGVLARLGLARGARDERGVQELTALRARARAQDLAVVRVQELRKVGVRGTAAWTVLDDGTVIDSWFWGEEPPVDCFLLVRAAIRRGSHTGDEVLFVGRGEPLEPGIIERLSPRVTGAATRLGVLQSGEQAGAHDAASTLRDAA